MNKQLGRPSSFTQEVADEICEELAAGKSLRTICSKDEMPGMTAVMNWLRDRPDFAAQYARAREAQADYYAESIVDIADEAETVIRQDGEDVRVTFDATAVARNRLRVDARKWYSSKLAPKKYGEKVAIGGADDMPPIKTAAFSMSREDLLAIAAQALEKSDTGADAG